MDRVRLAIAKPPQGKGPGGVVFDVLAGSDLRCSLEGLADMDVGRAALEGVALRSDTFDDDLLQRH